MSPKTSFQWTQKKIAEQVKCKNKLVNHYAQISTSSGLVTDLTDNVQ